MPFLSSELEAWKPKIDELRGLFEESEYDDKSEFLNALLTEHDGEPSIIQKELDAWCESIIGTYINSQDQLERFADYLKRKF